MSTSLFARPNLDERLRGANSKKLIFLVDFFEKMKIFRKSLENSEKLRNFYLSTSTCRKKLDEQHTEIESALRVPGGNQVDGLPPVLHNS